MWGGANYGENSAGSGYRIKNMRTTAQKLFFSDQTGSTAADCAKWSLLFFAAVGVTLLIIYMLEGSLIRTIFYMLTKSLASPLLQR